MYLEHFPGIVNNPHNIIGVGKNLANKIGFGGSWGQTDLCYMSDYNGSIS